VSLPAPNLDDRTFQSLVDEAKRMVQRKWPEWTGWTDHNVSDPGVTLIETFAFMVEQLIFRLNRVPDLNYIKFLELVGIELRPPRAAETEVTFWLTAPQDHMVPVPTGTEVATVRAEMIEAVTFHTDEPLAIVPCSRIALASQVSGSAANDQTDALAVGREISLFSDAPLVGDAFYVGLSNAVPRCIVAMRFTGDVEGYGINPRRPPRVWQARTDRGWEDCEIEVDETGGFNRAGDVVIHVPRGHSLSADGGRTAAWLRCLVTEPPAGGRPYLASPKIRDVIAFTVGGTTHAMHAEQIANDVIGTSEGVPGQAFDLSYQPVVFGSGPDTIEVSFEVEQPDGTMAGVIEPWRRVETFATATTIDKVFRLDATAGRIQFGPGVRLADGTVDQRGAVPARGAVMRAVRYRHGGGTQGNVGSRVLTVLKTSVPSVSRCENRRPAQGGVDGETLASAKQRAPLAFRTRDRAVTAEDFEYLTLQAAPEIARAKCLESTGEPGLVRVLVVPHVPDDPSIAGGFRLEHLNPSDVTLGAIQDDLVRRRVVGTRVVIEPPRYQGVTVVGRLRAWRTASESDLRHRTVVLLHRYLHPVHGGPDGTGWPFGRPLTPGEINAALTRVPGVDLVEEILLFGIDPVTNQRAQQPVPRLDLPENGLFFSVQHQVRIEVPT
jgi:predicted phage baseplate assembly protein